ncbi:hypothetical protein L2E82_27359 [Cichorium intybus]|uniref:Uncharacterized protein n=1 Tax=Cichorium intybus TaxID=13427 RepID=A0ACB9CT34_CICIN|nr:hypothetical protein L2E82_27359 [Cichorium intybus]
MELQVILAAEAPPFFTSIFGSWTRLEEKYELGSVFKVCDEFVPDILMAAGDTFRAAPSDQLGIWAERTGCEIVLAEKEKAKASSGR